MLCVEKYNKKIFFEFATVNNFPPMVCFGCQLYRSCLICHIVLAVCFLVLGTVVLIGRSHVIEHEFKKNLALVPPAGGYKNWVDLPKPITLSFRFFNMTNPEGFKAGEKPAFTEVGPYVYNEHHVKTDIRHNEENDTITYQRKRFWTYDAVRSKGSLRDRVVVMNAPAVAFNNRLSEMEGGKKKLFIDALTTGKLEVPLIGSFNIPDLTDEKLTVNKDVHTLIFGGYRDKVLTMMNDLRKAVISAENTPAIAWIMYIADIHLPEHIKMELPLTFCFYQDRNNTVEGTFNVYRGSKNISNLGKLYQWEYSTQGKHFYKPPCGDVVGAGDFFPPFRDEGHIDFFSVDMCRTLHLKFAEKVTKHDMSLHAYKVDREYLANRDHGDGSNWCFDPHADAYPSGVYGVSPCQKDAPVFMSQPHFYQADSFYLSQVGSGLKPEKEKHETVFYLEPTTGVTVELYARFQVNFILQNIPGAGIFDKVRQSVVPVFWVEHSFVLPDINRNEIYLLQGLDKIVLGVGIAFLTVGFASCLIVLAHIWNAYFIRKQKVSFVKGTTTASDDSWLFWLHG